MDGHGPAFALSKRKQRKAHIMTACRIILLGLFGFFSAAMVAIAPATAQQPQKPNILFIMGDDIGWMQPSIYHRGLMVGETPNIDRIGNEGALFTDYYAEQSCTAGRNAFFTGMHPLDRKSTRLNSSHLGISYAVFCL